MSAPHNRIYLDISENILAKLVENILGEYNVSYCRGVNAVDRLVPSDLIVVDDSSAFKYQNLNCKMLLLSRFAFNKAAEAGRGRLAEVSIVHIFNSFFKEDLEIFFSLFFQKNISMKYQLSESATVHRLELKCFSETTKYIKTLIDSVEGKLTSYLEERVESVCYELIMNAFFDSPRDTNGDQRYFDTDRSMEIVNEKGNCPELEWSSDDRFLQLSVRDFVGSFSKKEMKKIVDKYGSSEKRSYVRDKGAGAGIGLFLCVQNVSSLFISVNSRVETQVIARFRLSKRNKSYEEKVPSLIFCTNEVGDEVA